MLAPMSLAAHKASALLIPCGPQFWHQPTEHECLQEASQGTTAQRVVSNISSITAEGLESPSGRILCGRHR